jgi:hypothetical protein
LLVITSVGRLSQKTQATIGSTSTGMAAKPTPVPLFHNQILTDPKLQIPTGPRALQSLSAPIEAAKSPAEAAHLQFQLLMSTEPEQRLQSLIGMESTQRMNLYANLTQAQKVSLFGKGQTNTKASLPAAVESIPTAPSAMMNPLKRKSPIGESPASIVHLPATTSTGLPIGSVSTSSYYKRPPSPMPKSPVRQRRRSPSPNRFDRYRQSISPHISRSRSSSPEEKGCYVHGIHANHTTKNCQQAQLVIQPRVSHSTVADKRLKGSKKDEPNICIFCGLLFKPGHLGYCQKVPSRKKGRRN